jgi:predicted phage-related endonuclease
VIVVCTEQRQPEWYAARVGKLTGSAAGDMLARIKTGEAAARRDLRTRLVCERLTGQSQEDGFVSPAMQWGIEKEADAFAAYEAQTGTLVNRVGFLAHDTLPAGCSPDGEVGGYTGIIELKAPKSATHLKYIRAGTVPSDYLPQITHNLWITGAQWCDFASFDDRFPPALHLFRVRVERNQADIDAYELMARAFLNEVEAELAELDARAGAAA